MSAPFDIGRRAALAAALGMASPAAGDAAAAQQQLPTPALFARQAADPNSPERIWLESELGPRSFKAFFRMAWQAIDPAFLLWNWHIDTLCDEMEAVARRENTEAVFCVPPRSLKSQIMSVAFPAWVWTWNPAAKFITASNELTLATRDAVRMRRLVQGQWYQLRWGPGAPGTRGKFLVDGTPHPGVSLVIDQNNKTYYETTAKGHRFCCTPGSNVTGHGGDFVMVDDPHPTQKAESEAERLKVLTWWFEAIPTRLNEPDRGVKMVIQQRVHTSDLAGSCMRRGYHKVVLPMRFEGNHPDLYPGDPRAEGDLLHPERTNETSLQKLETALGLYGTAGQLQQRPTPRGGGLFKRQWFTIVDAVPAECTGRRVRRWDFAATVEEPGKDPDYTVGVLMSKDAIGRYYIEDVRRFRERSAEVDMAVKAVASQDTKAVPIGIPEDPGSAGKDSARARITMLNGYVVTAYRETGEKGERARPFASQAGIGNVFLVRGAWNETFLEEIETFPMGGHDDQVDAAVGAYIMLTGAAGMGVMELYREEAEREAAERAKWPQQGGQQVQKFFLGQSDD